MTALPPDLFGALRAEVARQGLTLLQVILFGSRAKGTPRPDSDWDLLIILREALDPAGKRRLLVRLEEALRAHCIPADLILVSEPELPYKAACVGNITHYALREGFPLLATTPSWPSWEIIALPENEIALMHKKESMHWLSYAESDLDVARMILENLRSKASLLGAASFHAQQAAEKALKAFLIFHQQPFPKNHSIKELLDFALR